MSLALNFEDVGKMYRLGRVGTGTLSHDLNRWWQVHVLHHEDPYLKIGEVNRRAEKGETDYVWALQHISFQVEQGEVLGIIGKNGAGKSTLLKLLSNITSPTTGLIQYEGRIASLLEVGTGFHPELTGRENIYMNGTILGMRREEITRKLDEIVDFAGVERYLDTPVKRYSSGMNVRLGFAVAAFLEPEILVVDEVLTVGDAEFQKKAVGKMQDISKGGARTVLFVSHNMTAVKNLCNRGIVLQDGLLAYDGNTDEAVDFYLQSSALEMSQGKMVDAIDYQKEYIHINKIMLNGTEDKTSVIKAGQEHLDLVIEGETGQDLKCEVMLHICDRNGQRLASLAEGRYKGHLYEIPAGPFSISKHIRLPKYLSRGEYFIDLYLLRPRVETYFRARGCANLTAEGTADPFCLEPNVANFGFFGLESEE